MDRGRYRKRSITRTRLMEYVYHCAAMISFDPKDEGLLQNK
jgi:hypothetical protein